MEIKLPLVSIIIPSYNQAKYLTEAVNSVISQTYSMWECIIINDGSTDNTEQVAKSLCYKDKRVKYITQENEGVCVARNNAISQSSGEYILCLDADDQISSNFLEETVTLIESNTNIKIVTSTIYYYGGKQGQLIPKSYNLDIILAENQIVITSLFRRSDYDSVNGFSLYMREGLEDWEFWIKLLKNGGIVKCASNAIFYYRIKKNSRNDSIDLEKANKLRHKIWQNNKELFSKHFLNPMLSMEYNRITNSREYKLGQFLLRPIRKLIR